MRRLVVSVCLLVFLVLGCEGPYGPDGYNAHGYNRMGYDKYGYDKKGYDSWGRGRPEGTPKPSAVTKSVAEKDVFGTGFAICSGEYVLTAFHVIQDANTASITVEFPGGKPVPATVSKRSFLNNVALLHLEKPAPSFLKFADPRFTKLGQTVYTLGYPAINVLGKETKYTDGTITSLSGIVDETSWLQVSVPTQPGSSGGPLLDTSGRIIGMIISKATVEFFKELVGTIPENVTWAVKAAHIVPILPAHCTPTKSYSGEGWTKKSIEETEKAVCLVRVKKIPE